MEHISTLLPRVLRKRGLKDQADAAFIVHATKRWFEEREGVVPDVRKFALGTLTIEVRSSVEAQECRALSGDLLDALQKQFPGKAIEHIRILRSADRPQGE